MIAEFTPMMRQYIEVKNNYKDCILFFRLGDFYEMFFDDAEIASRELEITLTGKDCGLNERAPMCGVPFHAVDGYIFKLVSRGYKVAICDQTEQATQGKGIVKREVTRVVTPGTVIEPNLLDEKKNNYIVCLYEKENQFGIVAADITIGDVFATFIDAAGDNAKLFDEISRYCPSEIVTNSRLYEDTNFLDALKLKFGAYISSLDEICFEQNDAKKKVETKFLDCGSKSIPKAVISAVGGLLWYLEQTQKSDLLHIKHLNYYVLETHMGLDMSARRNLELVETMREKSRKGSLLWVLDETITSMGSRELRKWVEAPLTNVELIRNRLDAVEEAKNDFMRCSEIRELLKGIYDIQRLTSKIAMGTVNCRDLISIKQSIARVPQIKSLLANFSCGLNAEIYLKMDELTDIGELIEKAIVDEPPIMVKEGNIIKSGYSEEIDRLRRAANEGKNWIAELEGKERENTKIKNLKVGFNRIFGYYIEVTKSFYHLVPQRYIRKQTLANCERYVIQELKEIEESILGAENRMNGLEYQEFLKVRDKIAVQLERIKNTARAVAKLDVVFALAEIANKNSFCKPEVNEDAEISIVDGRHPVVEKSIGKYEFVANDTMLDLEENKFNIITGPNMAGKSTYMRQVALIVLMAQIGSFVPAKSATIGLVDKIFTRVGASDDLASGQSTFMLEMSEVANILNNATRRSLLILDEIGRGTSTFDGLSIAWAVVEFVSTTIGSRTLFATHYHELTELEGKVEGLKNYCISVEEMGEDIVFLRKIIRGGADDSYGIQVAKLAGVHGEVITRAKEILSELEKSDLGKRETPQKGNISERIDLSFSQRPEKTGQRSAVEEELSKIDIFNITPIDALNILNELHKKAKEGGITQRGTICQT